MGGKVVVLLQELVRLQLCCNKAYSMSYEVYLIIASVDC